MVLVILVNVFIGFIFEDCYLSFCVLKRFGDILEDVVVFDDDDEEV